MVLFFAEFGSSTPRLCLGERTSWGPFCLPPSERPPPVCWSTPGRRRWSHTGTLSGRRQSGLARSSDTPPEAQESERGTSSPDAALGVFPSHHCTTHIQSIALCPRSPLLQSSGCTCGHPSPQPLPPRPALHITAHSDAWGSILTCTRRPMQPGCTSHTGGLKPTWCPSFPETTSLLSTRTLDHQGHIPQSSLCFGRSGVCPRWRPTLWPVGGAHGHHKAVPLAAGAGSSQGPQWAGSWGGSTTALRVHVPLTEPTRYQKAAASPYPRPLRNGCPSDPAKAMCFSSLPHCLKDVGLLFRNFYPLLPTLCCLLPCSITHVLSSGIQLPPRDPEDPMFQVPTALGEGYSHLGWPLLLHLFCLYSLTPKSSWREE